MITNLIPIRIDASSSDGAVRIIDTLLIDTTCLPISHCAPSHPPPTTTHDDGNQVSGSNSSSGGGRSSSTTSGTTSSRDDDIASNNFSLSSLIDANATCLTESILGDAEVYGAVRSSTKTYMGGRLDLLCDAKLYREVEGQIRTQLEIALTTKKEDLISGGGDGDGDNDDGRRRRLSESEFSPVPDGAISSSFGDRGSSRILPSSSTIATATTTTTTTTGEESKTKNTTTTTTTTAASRIIRIKLRLRQENVAVVDEFDYDIRSSGTEGGCDPFSIAESLVSDLNLPREMTPSIVSSIVEQIYGVDVSDSLEGFVDGGSDDAGWRRDVPAAMVLDVATDGSASDFARMIMSD